MIYTTFQDKKLSLLGFGAIAKGVARRARGFGMKILATLMTLTQIGMFFRLFLLGIILTHLKNKTIYNQVRRTFHPNS